MSGRVHAEAKAAPKSSFTPVRTGLLAGSRGKQLVSQPPLVQAKLTINPPNDQYEQEADRVADEVMRMPEPQVPRQAEEEEEDLIQTEPIADQITPLVQRQVEPEEEEELIQTKTVGDVTPEVTPATSSGIQSLQGGGQPLSRSERGFFELRFGTDFSNVRVHNNTRAASIVQSVNARAFTLGHNVVFGAGEYSSDTLSSRQLLAHELTHVVQQNGGPTLFSRDKNSENIIPNSKELSIVSPEFPAHVVQQTGHDTAHNVVQRACDDEIGPTPTGCNLVSKSPTGTRYLFRKGCDEFETGQRARLEAAARALPAGATVDILGMASSDGGPGFNQSLSCHRAAAASAVFAAVGKANSLAQIEATGEVPGTDNDANFRAVDIVIHVPSPPPPTPEPPTPAQPAPRIPVASCPCPAANPSCPPTYCAAMPLAAAIADRAVRAVPLIAVLTARGGTGVGIIYNQFVWGGLSGVMTLSGALRTEFATICQTAVATNHIMTAIINAIWGRYPASTPAQTIPLNSIAPTAVRDIGTPGNAHELVYCGSTNAPGLLAGGVGTTQLTTRVGAIPSSQNDSRTATGHIDVRRNSLPGGGTRLVFTPTINIEVRDTVDFCPGNCGSAAAQVATVPFSRWEASRISGDVAFVTQFAAPRSQLRKIVLQTVNGVDRWSLEPV
jgi:outer membrane protein OmpA-like peptidoglycan-associated protein